MIPAPASRPGSSGRPLGRLPAVVATAVVALLALPAAAAATDQPTAGSTGPAAPGSVSDGPAGSGAGGSAIPGPVVGDPMLYEGFEEGQPTGQDISDDDPSDPSDPSSVVTVGPPPDPQVAGTEQLQTDPTPRPGPADPGATPGTTSEADTTASPGTTPGAGYAGPVTSANARYVVAGYQALVGRQPDTAGLDHHLGRIAGGGDRSRLGFTYALLYSPEGSGNEVRRAYRDLLDRSPDPEGAAYWTGHLTGHGVADLRVLLLASDELVARAGGTERAWVDQLYTTVLGRAAEPAGVDYWLARRQAGVARALVVAAIYQSEESRLRRAATHYQELLGRAPSPAELTGTALTLATVDDREVRARMFASDEVFEASFRQAFPGTQPA